MASRQMVSKLVPDRLKNAIRRTRISGRWIIREFLKSPRFETYARRKNMQNRKSFLAGRAAGAEAVREKLDGFRYPAVQKVIWTYWDKGEAATPFVVGRCLDSWRRHNPGWDLRVLDKTNVADFVDMSDLPDVLPPRFFANLLRLRLLKTYGGVWADPTVFCHRALDEWLPLHSTTGFFVFRNPGPGRWLDSWFIASQKAHILITAWQAAYARYVRRLTYMPDKYFMFYYTFQWAIKHDPGAFAAWKQAPSLPAAPTFFMMEALRGHIPVDRVRDMLLAGTPVSKLTWKEEIDETAFDALCADLSQDQTPADADRIRIARG